MSPIGTSLFRHAFRGWLPFPALLSALLSGLVAAEAPPTFGLDRFLGDYGEDFSLAWSLSTNRDRFSEAARSAYKEWRMRFPGSALDSQLRVYPHLARWMSDAEIGDLPPGAAEDLLAELRKTGREKELLDAFQRLLAVKPFRADWSGFAPEAATLLTKMNRAPFLVLASNFTAPDRTAWAWHLYRCERWDDSLSLLRSVGPSDEFPDRDYFVGVCLLRLKRPSEAVPFLESHVTKRGEDPGTADDPRSWNRHHLVTAWERLGRLDLALSVASNWIAARPRDEPPLRTFWRISKAASPLLETNALRLWTSRTPNGPALRQLHRQMGFELLAKSRTEAGLSNLSIGFGGQASAFRWICAFVSNRASSEDVLSNRSLFFEALMLQPGFPDLVSLDAEATRNLNRILAGTAESHSLSRSRPTNRDASLPEGTSLPRSSNAPAEREIKSRTRALLALGWMRAAELETKEDPEGARPGILSSFRNRRLAFPELESRTSLSRLEKRFAKSPDLPLDELRLLFPAPRLEAALHLARLERLDPSLLLALMREESRFQADARSWVGATGLTQLMDSTGKAVHAAHPSRHEISYQPQDPVLNMALGARYLAERLVRFGGDEFKALAAYNAGAGNVERWVAQNGPFRNPVHFALLIPFDETWNYVQKVWTSRFFYRRLLDFP